MTLKPRLSLTLIASGLIGLMLLPGCSDPGLYTGIAIGPNGVSVRPVATARVGGARVAISP